MRRCRSSNGAPSGFPKSANAYDSLGEAYWHAGDRARAVASYQRSLGLDPKNDNAKKKMIELLR